MDGEQSAESDLRQQKQRELTEGYNKIPSDSSEYNKLRYPKVVVAQVILIYRLFLLKLAPEVIEEPSSTREVNRSASG